MTTSSPRLRIAIFEIPPNEETYLRQSALAEHDLFFHSEPLKPANLSSAKDADVLSVFIYSRIGIIGAGRIGLHVIRMAKGFGMNVLAYDVRQDHFLAEVLDFAYASLEELLAQSDVISLHAPYSARTHHLINRDTLELAKRGAILINTSRGGLVDTAALVWALDEGILAGAGLDVLEGEDLIKEERQLLASNEPAEKLRLLLSNHILRHRENVVITPHSAFNSREALNRILDTTIANILAFAADKPINIVRE